MVVGSAGFYPNQTAGLCWVLCCLHCRKAKLLLLLCQGAQPQFIGFSRLVCFICTAQHNPAANLLSKTVAASTCVRRRSVRAVRAT
jgi:hypothetical protein